jgi:lipid-A-disaccharide synthase
MIDASVNFPEYQFVIAGAPAFQADYYEPYLNGADIPIVFNATYDLLNHAHVAIVASGTATLETALFNVPQMVVYKGGKLTIAIARMLVKLKFISLVNLIMDKQVVKELIQEECTANKIGEELNLIVNNVTYRQNMLDNYEELDVRMGQPGASAKTAGLIVKYTKAGK